MRFQEIESPALLDPESAYEEIKQTLERLEKAIEQVARIIINIRNFTIIRQVRQKAFQFEAYEEKFEFPTHEYPEIDDVSEGVQARQTPCAGRLQPVPPQPALGLPGQVGHLVKQHIHHGLQPGQPCPSLCS